MKHQVFAAGALALLSSALAMPAQAAWEPNKPVEIIVPAGAGGASDQMARVIQSIVAKHQLMKQPIVITLKGGASGGEGLIDMKASKGNPHKIVLAQSSIYTLPFSSNMPFNWRDLTPVSLIAMDEFILWVNSETPYKTAGEFIAAIKKQPSESFKMGGTGSKREDHIITAAMEMANGIKFAYIPYKSGGEAAVQLVGKHTDSNVNNPSENIAQWRAGQVRALCVFDSERIPYTKKVTNDQSWGDIPPCKEQGLDIQYVMLRSIFLPGGVSKDQVAFYNELFKKISATAEYKEYLEANALKGTFMAPAEFTGFLEKDEAYHKKLMEAAKFMATTN